MANENIGAPNPAENAGAGGNNSNTNTNNGAPADKGVGGAAGAGEKTYSFKEDRTDWTPRHRLNEESTKRTAAERERDELRSKLDIAEKRTRVLAGVENVDPKAAEAEEVRSAIYELVPEIGLLKGLTREQLEEVLDAAKVARTSAQSTWDRHTSSVLETLDGEAVKSMGIEKLSATQQTRLHRAYRDEIMGAMAERQAAMQRGDRQSLESLPTDTDLVARHERGDKTLMQEFVKAYLADWYEPAKRSVSAQMERRMRPVPRGERSRLPVTQGETKVDLNDTNQFKKALIAARGASE